jgi:hypothetical protein
MENKSINALFFFLCFMFTFNTNIVTKRDNNNLRIIHQKENSNIKYNLNITNPSQSLGKLDSTLSMNSTHPTYSKYKDTSMKRYSERYNSLFIQSINNNSNGFINFKLREVNESFSIGLVQNNLSLISNKLTHLNIGENRSIIAGNHTLINSIHSYNKVMYYKVSQWRLISEDNFFDNETPNGWSYNKTSQCKHLYFLGGHCKLGKKEVSKNLINLPLHTEVKIEANFHFIGKWDSNTAYLRMDHKKKDDKYIWTETCKNKAKPGKMDSICSYETCKINSVLSVSLAHSNSFMTLIFGNDLQRNKPCESSYAISNFRVYIR